MNTLQTKSARNRTLQKSRGFLKRSFFSFDLESDVPELVPSISDMIVDSANFADLTNIL